MAITSKNFGKTPDGTQVQLYTITNGKGFTAEVTDFGAILVNLFVPDKTGKTADVVLGYDSVEGYLGNGCFFGSTIGPSANRIDNARFTIDGETYHLAANDGTNNLHSDDNQGYHKRVWNAALKDDSVVFTLKDADGTMGFPGNKNVQVTYTVTDENELQIAYEVTSDKKTLINMTNHSYFNLAGHNSGSIESHKLCINASHYTPVFERLIPTGELVDVTGTPFDFRTMKPVGQDIDKDDTQLGYGQGYDHNYALDGFDGSIQKAASVEEPATGRKMDVYTDQPGIQFYAGSCITPQTGKGGAAYGKRSGLCLETQCFPDAVNQPQFQDVIYGPDRPYKTTTIYKFYNEGTVKN
ncbi:MAG: galactose mutarotase [Lachnospiraceae bacterium]|nr:galactose mutarotase [Lachnospiraceae bacterium]